MNTKEIKSFITNIRKEFEDFFELKMELKVEILIIKSRSKLDSIKGEVTEKWVVGFTRNETIYILDPDIFEEESTHKKEEFWQVLKHEYSHICFRFITNGESKPVWLNEGLAVYIAGQKKRKPSFHEALALEYYFDRLDKFIYPIGYFWVKYLITTFGKEKIIRLIKTIGPELTKEEFYKNFKEVFGFNLDADQLKKISKDLLN